MVFCIFVMPRLHDLIDIFYCIFLVKHGKGMIQFRLDMSVLHTFQAHPRHNVIDILFFFWNAVQMIQPQYHNVHIPVQSEIFAHLFCLRQRICFLPRSGKSFVLLYIICIVSAVYFVRGKKDHPSFSCYG